MRSTTFFSFCSIIIFQFSQVNALLFDPLTKPIDVSGKHAFKAPDFDAGDVRGPCPGLNALANHGYIPHDGVVGFLEVIAAINQVYGMGIDTSTVLAAMGTVWVGNPISLNPGFSIGGYTDKSNNILGNLLGLLGTPRGLVGSHNFIESDSSNTRDDLYVTGDSQTLNMTAFMDLYNMSNGTGDYNFDIFAERASIRFKQTVAENPNFYYGPVTGLVARNAGFLFAARLFSNHSWENPAGTLTKDILKSFYSIHGEEGNFTYLYGHESIPDNWYRAPVDYGLVALNLDLVAYCLKYPELASIGGNTGTVNSFTGIDLADLTGGVFNLSTLLEGNNLLCFVFEALKFITPNSLSGLFATLDVPLKMVLDAISVPLLDLACPAFDDLKIGGKDWTEGIVELYPGAKMSSGGL
ncbi:oxidase [Phlyctema vagabunda]|uniref:Oxidase n=1 Tax=Phlyctema vagabunda TaxID=108571 RepID=A0ABR4PB38_9HELO